MCAVTSVNVSRWVRVGEHRSLDKTIACCIDLYVRNCSQMGISRSNMDGFTKGKGGEIYTQSWAHMFWITTLGGYQIARLNQTPA